jgi:hypothetical protein
MERVEGSCLFEKPLRIRPALAMPSLSRSAGFRVEKLGADLRKKTRAGLSWRTLPRRPRTGGPFAFLGAGAGVRLGPVRSRPVSRSNEHWRDSKMGEYGSLSIENGRATCRSRAPVPNSYNGLPRDAT